MKIPEAPAIELPVPTDAASRSFSDLFGPLSFEMLDNRACRWPLSDPFKSDFVYCGADRERDLPYCRFHFKVAFKPGHHP